MTQDFGMISRTFEDRHFLGDHPVVTQAGVLSGGSHVSEITVNEKAAAAQLRAAGSWPRLSRIWRAVLLSREPPVKAG